MGLKLVQEKKENLNDVGSSKPSLRMRGSNRDTVYACKCRGISRRVRKHVASVYVRRVMQRPLSKASTCLSSYGRLAWNAVTSKNFYCETFDDIYNLEQRVAVHVRTVARTIE